MCVQILKLTALEPPLPLNASAGPPLVPYTAQAQVVTHDNMATEETVPVRSFMPIFLSDFVIQVQLRDRKKQNLVSKPLKEVRITIGLVLQEIFKDLPY